MTVRRSLFTLVGGLIVAFVVVTDMSAPDVAADSLPYVGYPVHESIRNRLPSGGTILAVSESCFSCQLRASSFVSAVASRPDHILLVAVDGAHSRFRTLARGNGDTVGRVLFVSPSELRNQVHVRAVPSFVRVDDRGAVLEAGPSAVGRIRAMVDPLNWVRSWRRLVSRSVSAE